MRFLPLFFFGLAAAVPWYVAYDLPAAQIELLMDMDCYRGTYGLSEDLSLFNCVPKDESEPFLNAQLNAPLCVVELNLDLSQRDVVIEAVHNSLDSQILWTGKSELIIGPTNSTSTDYPSSCSRSFFPRGSMLNAIVVPFAPKQKMQTKQSELPQSFAPDPKIVAFLNGVSKDQLTSNVATLSGYWTRLSTAAEGETSALWIRNQLQGLNYFDSVSTNYFRSGYCPNVIATKLGSDPTRWIYVGAHSDCRASNINSATERAPGSDDNAGSVSMLLEFARNLKNSGIKTRLSIGLVTFCGEEQGLYGSQDQAAKAKAANLDIQGFYNSDMIAYKCGAQTVLTFDSRSVDTGLTDTCKAIANEYFPTYQVGSNSGCCSDNQSYQNQGYRTVSFFECPGRTVDNPNYHKTSDNTTNIDYDQLFVVSKLVMACVLTQAGVL